MVGWRVGTGRVLGAALDGRGEVDVAHRVCGDGQGREETAQGCVFVESLCFASAHSATPLHRTHQAPRGEPHPGCHQRGGTRHDRDVIKPSTHVCVREQEVGTEEARLERRAL